MLGTKGYDTSVYECVIGNEDTGMPSITASWNRKTTNDGCMMHDTNELNI